MEHLFTTSIRTDGEPVSYHVVFDQEQYIFTPEGGAGNSFAFRREHDEWHPQQNMPPEVQQQAVDALEKFLLRQH